jgi:hypothetical protein
MTPRPATSCAGEKARASGGRKKSVIKERGGVAGVRVADKAGNWRRKNKLSRCFFERD